MVVAMNLEELQKLSVDKIREQLDELNGEQLNQLRAIESAHETPRATLLKALDAKITEIGGTAEASDGEFAHVSDDELVEAGAKIAAALAARGKAPEAAAPAWQAPDYVGVLDGAQAEWRMKHLKPDQAKA